MKQFNKTIIYLLLALASIYGNLYSSKVFGLDPESTNIDSKPMPKGVTCYLVGPDPIKANDIKDLEHSLDILEKLYTDGKLTKEVYLIRKKEIEEQLKNREDLKESKPETNNSFEEGIDEEK
ncbi:MAG: hypothetical protein AB1782_09420 [Cyanobacteriota bacterium]